MAKAYSIRPSSILFPYSANPNVQLAIDNIVFEMGYSYELEQEIEMKKIEMKNANVLLKALTGVG